MLSLVKILLPLITISLAIYATIIGGKRSKILFLTTLITGLALSIAVPGDLPAYPEWNFYPEPAEQNETYYKLMIADNKGNTIIYDQRASILGSAGSNYRPASLLISLKQEERNKVTCKLIKDAERYRQNIISGDKSIVSSQGYGKRWNNSSISSYGNFTSLIIKKERVSLTFDGRAVENRNNTKVADYTCS